MRCKSFGVKIFNYSINFVHPESIKDLIPDNTAMGSTLCVRCGATLIPHSYCDVCHDVLCFTCSSCSTSTDERIHAYCHIASIHQNNNGIRLDTQQLMEEPKSYQLLVDNTQYYIQDQLNDEIKYNSINLSTSYLNSMFESIKLVNRYWSRIFNIGNSSSSIA